MMLSGEKFVYKGFGRVERGQLRGVGYAVGYVPGVVAGYFEKFVETPIVFHYAEIVLRYGAGGVGDGVGQHRGPADYGLRDGNDVKVA